MKLLNFFEEVELLHGASRDVKVGEASREGAGEAAKPVEEATVQQHATVESQGMAARKPKGLSDGDVKDGSAEQNGSREERGVGDENGRGCNIPLSSAENGEVGEGTAASGKESHREGIHVGIVGVVLLVSWRLMMVLGR